MRIPIDRRNSLPIYRQIEAWLRQNILCGNLPSGTRLPATRALAEKLGVSRITVKNAYALLESDGLIETREGSGTFVAQTMPGRDGVRDSAGVNWPRWQREITGPGLSLKPASMPRHAVDLIRFTGVGDAQQFPLKEFERTMQQVLRRDGVAALEYGNFDGGYPPLRETVVRILASQGIQSRAEEVLITSGSQQGVALACQVLLKEGDAVLVEKPTYNLALELFRSLNLKIVGVPLDEAGMQVERVEALLVQHQPRLIYTIPNFQNPSGVCMSGGRRRQLLSLADRYQVPILEDDFAADLRYEGRAQPAIKALDGGGQVIYVSTFSKMLMPGLRVGYLLASGPVFERLVWQKYLQDMSTAALMQRTLERYVTIGRYQAHLRRSVRLYRRRRDVMLAAIRRHLPEEVTVFPAQGGLFLWVQLPGGVQASHLLELAQQEGVEFAPGTRFFPEPSEGEAFLRLNFATRTTEEIELGIERLGVAIKKMMGRQN